MQENKNTHYMQSYLWAIVKTVYGWKSDMLPCKDILSEHIVVYKRTVPGVGKLAYIPGLSGITKENAKTVTKQLAEQYKKKVFAVRLELNQPHDEELLTDLKKHGWGTTQKHVQYRHTVHVDLTRPENDIWVGFKSRGRYEVLQAQKFGVEIEEAELNEKNFARMYKLMGVTSERNKFFIRGAEFTHAYWSTFAERGQLKLFFAKHEGDTLAGAIILTNGELAWYKDGGSVREKSNMMAARLLQWEAMKALKQDGIQLYDLGGIPAPEGHQTSSMKGIYVFKTAYSKETVELMPTLELPLSSRYKLWPKTEKQWLRVYNLLAHNLWW